MTVSDDQGQGSASWATSGYEKGRRTRRMIVSRGSELFAAGGYEGTSIDQIARACGTTKGAIYAHFKRKRELYLACMDDSLAFLRDGKDVADASTPRERLQAYLLWFGSQLRDHPHARSFFIQMIRERDDDPAKVELILELLAEPYAQMRAVLSDANPSVDAGAFAFLIFSSLLLDPDLHRYHRLMAGEGADSHSLDTTVDQLVEAVCGDKT